MAFEFKPVTSSQFTHAAYDPTTLKLRIKFNNGAVYEYHDVEPHVHEGLMKSESKGSYFANSIKNAGYAYRKVSSEE